MAIASVLLLPFRDLIYMPSSTMFVLVLVPTIIALSPSSFDLLVLLRQLLLHSLGHFGYGLPNARGWGLATRAIGFLVSRGVRFPHRTLAVIMLKGSFSAVTDKASLSESYLARLNGN